MSTYTLYFPTIYRYKPVKDPIYFGGAEKNTIIIRKLPNLHSIIFQDGNCLYIKLEDKRAKCWINGKLVIYEDTISKGVILNYDDKVGLRDQKTITFIVEKYEKYPLKERNNVDESTSELDPNLKKRKKESDIGERNKNKQNRTEEMNLKSKEEWIQENLNNTDFQEYSQRWGPFNPPDIEVNWKEIIKEREYFENRKADDKYQIYKNMKEAFIGKLTDEKVKGEFMSSYEKAQSEVSDLLSFLETTISQFQNFQNNQDFISKSSDKLTKIRNKLKDESTKEVFSKLLKSYYYENTEISPENDFMREKFCTIYSIKSGLPVKLKADRESYSVLANVYGTNTNLYENLSFDNLVVFLIKDEKMDYKLVGEYLSIVLGFDNRNDCIQSMG